MKPCAERWKQEIDEHAMGAPLNAALEAHLEECPSCRGALIERKARMSRIDAGVRDLAASEPSPQAIARALAAQSQNKRRRAPHWWKAVTALAGAAVVVLCVTYAWEMHRGNEEARRALSAGAAIASWRSPTRSLLESPSDRWLRATPRLGESFYPLEMDVKGKEKKNP
jgi:predicted anti-sigma-YlaC factor YlaD